MAAANTDKLKKLSRRWVGQIGSGGVADASVTTVPLASATNLATDTAVVATINRVDANGEATPALEETIIGVVSGSNLVSCIRGVEGTAQAHDAGDVVEILVTAKGWNDLIDHLLVGHNQDGSHGSGVIVASNIASSAVTSGKIGASAVVAGNIAASAITLGNLAASSVSEGNLNFSSGLISTSKYAPQGFLLNGKIAVSVASNNLTVAIKGMDGNDPSASNPVYCRIGDTVRTITSALSVTKNAGTNWFNAGSAQLATKEIDYFVYLGYNATDGVVIGFSRIPHATRYGDFSATTTNEKYAAISTITTANSADYYENIGRFAATLSAGAGYTWTVPTFTALNLIQRPIRETRELDFTSTVTTNGTAFTNAPTLNLAKYKVVGEIVHIWVQWTFHATSGGDGAVLVTPPLTLSNSYQSGTGFQVTNGFDLGVVWSSGSGALQTYKYDATTIISNSASCIIGGVYKY